jgi:hypothetical protein
VIEALGEAAVEILGNLIFEGFRNPRKRHTRTRVTNWDQLDPAPNARPSTDNGRAVLIKVTVRDGVVIAASATRRRFSFRRQPPEIFDPDERPCVSASRWTRDAEDIRTACAVARTARFEVVDSSEVYQEKLLIVLR